MTQKIPPASGVYLPCRFWATHQDDSEVRPIMQTQEHKGLLDVKRHMDLVRDILHAIEDDDSLDGSEWKPMGYLPVEGYSQREIAYHVMLLSGAGFIVARQLGTQLPDISKLTWNGHEFCDDTRDPDVWEKTKERAKGLTGVGIAFIWELAKAEVRKRLGL